MAAALSLSLSGSNYSSLPAKARRSVEKPELSVDTWTLTTKKTSRDLTVENYDRQSVEISKAEFNNLDFRYFPDGGGAAQVTQSELKDSSFLAGNKDTAESLTFGGGAKLKNTTARLGGGVDSVEFKAGSRSGDGLFALGKGADTAVFFAKSKVGTGNRVDLGKDSDVDVVDIAGKRVAKGLVITNFGDEDILKIGGKQYGIADVPKNLRIEGIIVKPQDS